MAMNREWPYPTCGTTAAERGLIEALLAYIGAERHHAVEDADAAVQRERERGTR